MTPEFVSPLIEAASAFYRFGWLLGTSGNLSRRIDEQSFVITASGRDKGSLGALDFITVTLDGAVAHAFSEEDQPSAETAIHRVIYKHSPEVGAIYHVHDPYAALCSRKDDQRTVFREWEMIKGLGIWDRTTIEVPIFENYEDVRLIAETIGTRLEAGMITVPGVCIEGHGVYAWGASPDEAKRHIETFAYLYRVSWEESAR